MATVGQDTLKTRRTLTVGGKEYDYYSLPEASKELGDSEKILSILIGAGLFTFAAAMLIWAKDISKNLYR